MVEPLAVGHALGLLIFDTCADSATLAPASIWDRLCAFTGRASPDSQVSDSGTVTIEEDLVSEAMSPRAHKTTSYSSPLKGLRRRR